MAILRAYLDDSGDATNLDHAFMTVAGYLADEDGWRHFERRWKEELDRAEVPYLHMREFGDRNGIFQHIKQNIVEEADFVASLKGVIYESVSFCTQTTIRLKDLREFNRRRNLQLDPYALAIYGCLLGLRREYPNDEIEVVVDRFERSSMRVEMGLDYARSDRKEDLRVDLFTPVPLQKHESFKEILPLQAADFVAWEMRKACEDRKSWNITPEDRSSTNALLESYEKWFQEHLETFKRPPRERKSFLELRESPVLMPKGFILDYTNLEEIFTRHPQGWA